MIHPEIMMGPFEGRDWANFVRLFSGAGGGGSGRRLLLLLHRQGVVVKAIHSQRGVLRGVRPDIEHLDQVALEHDADTVICLTPEDLGQIFAEAEGSVDPGADYVEQMMALIKAASLGVRSRVRFWPKSPLRLKHVPYGLVERLFKWLWPDGTSFGLFVLDDGGRGIHASLILSKEDGQITEMANADALDLEGANLADQASTREAVMKATDSRPNAPWCRIFLGRTTFTEMLRSGRPLSFLKLCRRCGTAVIDPYPFRLRLLFFLGRVFARK